MLPQEKLRVVLFSPSLASLSNRPASGWLLQVKNRLAPVVFALSVLLGLSACQTYNRQSADFNAAWRSGDVQAATRAGQAKLESHRADKDTVVWALEQGSALRLAAMAAQGKVQKIEQPGTPGAEAGAPLSSTLRQQSLEAFEVAENRIAYYDSQAKLRVGLQTGALLTNLANLPYEGRAYERILLHTYKTLTYLELGDSDKARVELNRLLQSQRDAVQANAKRLAEAEDAARKARKGQLYAEDGRKVEYDTQAALQDANVAGKVGRIEEAVDHRLVGYAPYVNPFAVFLDGLFFASRGEGPSDFERSRKSFERAVALHPENGYLREDLRRAEGLAQGVAQDPLTYVVFETGLGPHLEELRLDVPLFAFSERLSYVGTSLPILSFNDHFVPHLEVGAEGQTYRTEIIGNLDGVVSQDYKDGFGQVLTKTLLSTALKASASMVIQNQLRDKGETAEFLGSLLTGLANYATTIADTRCWSSLPKQFQYCRFRTPEDRRLRLKAGEHSVDFRLEPARLNLVLVKNVAPGLPVYVTQIALQ